MEHDPDRNLYIFTAASLLWQKIIILGTSIGSFAPLRSDAMPSKSLWNKAGLHKSLQKEIMYEYIYLHLNPCFC